MRHQEQNSLQYPLHHLQREISLLWVILVVILDQRSLLGLVRLRAKKTAEVLTRIFDEITSKTEKEKVEGGKAASSFAEISDEDIDNLFKQEQR